MDEVITKSESSEEDIPNSFAILLTYKYPNKNPVAIIIPYQYIDIFLKFMAIGDISKNIFNFGKET